MSRSTPKVDGKAAIEERFLASLGMTDLGGCVLMRSGGSRAITRSGGREMTGFGGLGHGY
jgi:hypothetical protein